MIKYLSPTSIKLFNSDIEEFYLKYVSDVDIPRFPQTQPMAAGSAFDAFVKSHLYGCLFGENEFDLRTIFENQVEKYNWDWAWEAGKHIFEEYKKAGCVDALLIELSKAVGKPRFEFSVSNEVKGVPLLGKPDVFFINSDGARVVYDWKVNGYCSSRLKSPMKGYIILREIGKEFKVHKDCFLLNFKNILINAAMKLEDSNKDWADQLAIYSWLLGEEVGSEEVIFGIEQICGPKDRLRFASHRLKISPEYQYHLLELAQHIWNIVTSGWIFRELTEEQSRERCKLLENSVKGSLETRELGGLEEESKKAFSIMSS